MFSERPERTVDGVRWVRLCRSIDVVERRGFRVELDWDTDIALFRVAGVARAVSNVCPHKRAAMIYDGFIENGTVQCPLHGWTYDICTGDSIIGASRLAVYKVLEEQGWVWVTPIATSVTPR
ncbi:MAG: Rieske 2Fe-2S domain-containing protein [bacterium]|nr:Rieske 2Fe-2S domain-containing protein [bacterium]